MWRDFTQPKVGIGTGSETDGAWALIRLMNQEIESLIAIHQQRGR
jgi:hypothetical protein